MDNYSFITNDTCYSNINEIAVFNITKKSIFLKNDKKNIKIKISIRKIKYRPWGLYIVGTSNSNTQNSHTYILKKLK